MFSSQSSEIERRGAAASYKPGTEMMNNNKIYEEYERWTRKGSTNRLAILVDSSREDEG